MSNTCISLVSRLCGIHSLLKLWGNICLNFFNSSSSDQWSKQEKCYLCKRTSTTVSLVPFHGIVSLTGLCKG